MFDLINRGGPIMWVIAALSPIAVAIIVERLIYFRKIRIDEDKMIARLKAALGKQHYDEALAICESSPSPISNLARVGIENRAQPRHVLKDVILDAASQEIPKLERFLSALGTIVTVAPLLGLLGTVTGNIKAFDVLGKFGSVGDPSLLANGIAEALLTTVGGLVVAIPCVVFHNYLVATVNHIVIRLENRVNELLLFIGEKE
jgi:biopolymer transport protein ExbB